MTRGTEAKSKREAGRAVPGARNQSDKKQAFRQWCILKKLDSGDPGITVRELAVEFQTSQRTILRDLELLQSVGFPLEPSTGPHGRKYWRRMEGLIPSINLSLTEAAALYLSRRLLEPLAGTYLFEAAQDAHRKFQLSFNEHTLKYLSKFAGYFHTTQSGAADYSTYGPKVDALMVAIEDRRMTNLTYQSERTTEPYTRPIHPYHLVYHKQALYLIAWAEDHQAFRNYRVDRISDVDSMELKFEKQPFDINEYLAGSFGIFQGTRKPTRVRIQFQPNVVRFVKEKHWHESEVLTDQSDGTLVAEFLLTSFEEVKSWILSFGPNAKVLEPPELIDEVLRDLRQTLQSYAPAAPIDGTSKIRVKIQRNTGEEPT